MKLEFESIEELIEFYQKYIEPKKVQETKSVNKEKSMFERAKENNKISMKELSKIIK
ncbi:MAG: hypothetical protein U9O87_02155 [Verrucomicrobiota bacterium]|nr:hypothetical protein [Verrucomicrobiota bacterium]